MDPIVVSLTLGSLVAAAISGIVGNRADAAVTAIWQTVMTRLRRADLPANHELQRAVLRSYFLALRSICDGCIKELKIDQKEHREAIGWLQQKKRDLDENLRASKKAEQTGFSVEALDEIELLVLPDGSLAQDRIALIRDKLIASAVADAEAPTCYRAAVEAVLFERIGIFMADQLKTDQRASQIFGTQLLAKIDVRLNGQQLTIDRMASALADLGRVELRSQAHFVAGLLRHMTARLEEAGASGVKHFVFDKERDEVVKLFALVKARGRADLEERLQRFQIWYNRYLEAIRRTIAGQATWREIDAAHHEMIEWYETNILPLV